MGRRLPWSRRETVASAAALAALLSGAAACGSAGGSAGSTTTVPASTTTTPTASASTTIAPATSAPAAPATTAPRPTSRRTAPVTDPTTRGTTSIPRATTTTFGGPYCTTNPDGTQQCVMPGRPLRRRRRGRKPGLLLPEVPEAAAQDVEARAEYASVASFGELALRLLAVGAPAELVAACHRSALDEIRHAATCDALAGHPATPFGAIPGLLGRPLGGWRRSRRVQLQRLAVESFLDGWVNEGAAAAELRDRAEHADSADDRAALEGMADDEQRHADLARSIVTWCFEEDPAAVGRVLAQVALRPVAA